MRQIVETALEPMNVRNAIKIAMFVGLVLNLINQGMPLLRSETLSWPHLLLNFLVPYCVASYSAAKNQLARQVVANTDANSLGT